MNKILIFYMVDGSIECYGPFKNLNQARDYALLRPTDGSIKGWCTADLLDKSEIKKSE